MGDLSLFTGEVSVCKNVTSASGASARAGVHLSVWKGLWLLLGLSSCPHTHICISERQHEKKVTKGDKINRLLQKCSAESTDEQARKINSRLEETQSGNVGHKPGLQREQS